MMVEPPPASPLEVIEAELVFELLVIAFDAPADLGESDEVGELDILRHGGEPVFRGPGLVGGPFDEQPFPGPRLAAQTGAMRGPDAHGREAGGQGALGPRAPADRLPRSLG